MPSIRKFLITITTISFILLTHPFPTFADLGDEAESMSFEFVSPKDKEVLVFEDCNTMWRAEDALRLEYSTNHSEGIILRFDVGIPEQFYFHTYRSITSKQKYLLLAPITTQTYAWKATPVTATEDPFNNKMPPLTEGWYMTFDIVCLNEVKEEPPEEEIVVEDPEEEVVVEEEEEIVVIEEEEKSKEVVNETEVADPPVVEEKENIFQRIIKKVKSIVSDIRDVFTWNIEFNKIDWDMFLPEEEDMLELEEKEEEKEPEVEEIQRKPFGFPFSRIIGVTQWYGNTAYQKPHTGIDFGATEEEIISPGDGEVVALGWDNFNGECFSGGNYMVIKHTNGMHTAYFHIEKYFVKLGDHIKRGYILAISGKSGKWNCQDLAYHLHFETREGRYQQTHVNPVDYIDVNWEDVPTLGYKYNPGRLSGENPHPTY
jgi:murein DD-endopeptidase MepM/ murein hydrolase activator NlpD